MNSKTLTFWDHLDELRKVLFRMIIVLVLFAIVAFFFKEVLFGFVFAPNSSDFITYQLMGALADRLSLPSLKPGDFQVELISTQLTSQFLVHIRVTIYAALLCASPYIIYLLFRFVSPALYANEKKYSRNVIFFAFIFFFLGAALSYYIIFPFSFRFLSSYQVTAEVANMFTINSYIDTFMMITVLMGILFEIPVVAWLFAKLGFLSAGFLKKYRKHALVVILVVAAIITPTTDIITLLLVSLPIELLYEASILIVKRVEQKRALTN